MRIAWLEGDCIGPEIMASCRQVLKQADDQFKLNLELVDIEIGLASLENQGTTFSENAFEEIQKCEGIVLGPVSHFDYPDRSQGGLNPSGQLRTRLDLYANLRPAFTRSTLPYFGENTFDLLIARENTEGFYTDRNMYRGSGEYMPTPDLALATRKISRHSCLRIAKIAFEQAMKRNKRVTAVHKANVLRISDGLFLECVREIASQYPAVEYNEAIVDAMAAHLIRHPQDYDVIVTTNMYGDILSDQATEMSGGLGLAGSLNLGDSMAMAQAQHGSAPDIAGLGIANPVSIIASTIMLLDWYGLKLESSTFIQAASAISKAMELTLQSQKHRTRDLGGEATTQMFSDQLCNHLNNSRPQ